MLQHLAENEDSSDTIAPLRQGPHFPQNSIRI